MVYVICRDENGQWCLEIRDPKSNIVSSKIYAASTSDLIHFIMILDGSGFCQEAA